MIVRALTVAGAVAGGAGMSQFPEYSQQYQQRLAGAVDEMRVVVAQFDDSLASVGKTRAEVFMQTGGSDLERQLIDDGKSNIARIAHLETALARVKDAPILQRLFASPAVADRKVAAAAWSDFKPALPLTIVGLACAGIGLILGWVFCSILFGLLTLVFGCMFKKRVTA